MYFLCEETDKCTQFRIIDKYFASMFRRLQFTFPEGEIVIDNRKGGKEAWGLAPRKISINVLPTTLENAPSQAYRGVSEEPFG